MSRKINTIYITAHEYFLAAIAVLLISLSTHVEAKETLVLGTPSGPPLSNTDQSGFLDRVVSEALDRIGYQLKVSHLPGERALINANNGIDDGDLHRVSGLNKTYPNLIKASEKTMTMEFVAFSKKFNFATHNWDSLKPYTVGFINGWKILEKNVPKGTDVTKVKNSEQLFSLLMKDRVDVILFNKWRALKIIRDNQYHGIKTLQPSLARKDMFVYFHRKHSDLVPAFSAALKQIKEDGLYQEIFDEVLKPFTIQ